MGRRAKTWADGSRENAIHKAQFAVHDKMAKPRSQGLKRVTFTANSKREFVPRETT